MHTESEDINLNEIYKVLNLNKKFLIILTVAAFIFSIFYSLKLPNIYKSEALLSVVEQNNSSVGGGIGTLASQYSGLSSLIGISSSNSSRAQFAIEKIKSRDFLRHLLTFDNVLESLYAPQSYDLSKNILYFDNSVYDSSKNIWVREIPPNRELVPSYLEVYSTYLESISIEEDKSSGYIRISVKHISPVFANNLLQLIIQEANNLAKNDDLAEANNSLEYLNLQLKSVTQSDIRKSINDIIESQLKIQMFANIRDDYLLVSLDKPFIPEVKSEPSRALLVIITTFLGFLIASILTLANYYIFKLKILKS